MSRLLRGVLCVIETFHKYAREAGDEATLTCTELKQLIRGEFGDVLQPHAIPAVERNLNLLDIHSNSTIGFDEFVLAIFNLLNLCYLDIQPVPKSEPRQVSKPEEMPSGMDLQGTSGTGQWTEQTPATQDRVVPSSGMALSAQLSPKERGHNGVDPQGDTKTYKLQGEASEHNDSKNQHLEKDQQSQETVQDIPATGDSGAPLERNEPRAESEQIGGPTKGKGQDEDSPREGDNPVKEQSSSKTRDRFGEQEGNRRTQSDLPGESPRPSKDREVAVERGVKEHPKPQALSPPGKDEPSSGRADPPEQEAAQKPFQTEKAAEPEDGGRTPEPQGPGEDAVRAPPETKNPAEPREDGRTSETQEPPAREKGHETKNLPVQSDSADVSETPDVRAVRRQRRGSEARGTAGETENAREIQLPTLEEQPQDGKYQELQEPPKERLEEDSKVKGLSSQGGNQNHPETEGAVTPKEATQAEKGIAEALVSFKNATVAEGTPGARERAQELEPVKSQCGEEDKRVTKTRDEPAKEGGARQAKDPEATRTQSHESSSETPRSLTPEDGDSSSETHDSPVQEDAQSQVDPLRESVERSPNNNPDTEKQAALGGERRTQEAVVLAAGGGLTEGPEWAARGEHRSQGSGTKGPGPAVHPDGHPEAQESTASDENRRSLEREIPGALDVRLADQLSVRQLPAKEDSSKMLKVQGPRTKGGAPETQETRVKSLDEDNSASPKTQLEREEPATSEEDEIPQELAGEANDQQHPAKKGYDASAPQSGLEEKVQTDQEPRFLERAVYASPLYQYLREKLLQQADMTQAEQQNRAQSDSASSPDRPVFSSDGQAFHATRERLPGADPGDAQQTSAPRASEGKQDHRQGGNPVLQREASTKKQ